MDNTLPLYVAVCVVGANLIVTLAAWIGIYRVSRNPSTDIPESARTWIAPAMIAYMVVWFLLALIPGRQEFYRFEAGRFPTIAIGVVVPMITLYCLYLFWGPVRKTIDALPLQWLVAVQTYRYLGAIFLPVYALGKMSGLFCFPASFGDLILAVPGPLVAYFYWKKKPWSRKLVLIWNIYGFLDLSTVLTIGFLSGQSPIQIFKGTPDTGLLGLYPLVIMSCYGVPLSYLIHMVSLTRLLGKKES